MFLIYNRVSSTDMERFLGLPECHWPRSRGAEPPAEGGRATVEFPWAGRGSQHSMDPKLMGELDGKTS